MADNLRENTVQTRIKEPRSDFWREIHAFLIEIGLQTQTSDLVLKVRYGDKVKLVESR